MSLVDLLLTCVDCRQLERAGSEYLQEHNEGLTIHWQQFVIHLKNLPPHQKISLNNAQKLWLERIALSLLEYDGANASQLSQLAHLSLYLKTLYGAKILQQLFSAPAFTPDEMRFEHVIGCCQLLIDLKDVPMIMHAVGQHLPNFSSLLPYLQEQHEQLIQEKSSFRNIEDLIERFATQDEQVQFPLSEDELGEIKLEFIAIQEELARIRQLPLASLQAQCKTYSDVLSKEQNSDAKAMLLATIIEVFRRSRNLYLYDTQILSLLALLHVPENFKGRIAQIKTGEGKSAIIALLAAFQGCTGNFVDVITSSDYLARRDCETFAGFYKNLGLTTSHISKPQPEREDFTGQILYGTTTDFEFALLREGLYNESLRYSYKKGCLQRRTYDVAINDEIDNLFLDMARNSALLSLPSDEDITWIYAPILKFVQEKAVDPASVKEHVPDLRTLLTECCPASNTGMLEKTSDKRLSRWLNSAYSALNIKQERKDYVIKPVRETTAHGHEYVPKIVIVDYTKTGRMSEGSQWQHGLYQFLQAKHNLPITEELLTGASIAHPTFYKMYQTLWGLTGTMGEQVERDEIREIYQVDSVDIPSHSPSVRERLPSMIAANADIQHQALLKQLRQLQKAGRPSLILFETIKESEDFHAFLQQHHIKHLLINATQRESEDYLVARAGEPGMVTVATNAAGRGTDVSLAPASKEAGGLHVTFAFYPENSRVENQGFGRAGRQGQPGTCNMMLRADDHRITRLCQRFNEELTEDERLGLIEYFASIDAAPDAIEADEFLLLLDRLRHCNIIQESEDRKRCAEHETIFFKKLQKFFDNQNAVYQLLESQPFEQEFITRCCQHSGSDAGVTGDTPDSKWDGLIHEARLLLARQDEGNAVDWSAFYNHFKRVYLLSIKKCWAAFYNQLHDDIGYHTTDVRQKVKTAYQSYKEQLDNYLTDPEQAVLTKLNSVLATARRALALPTANSSYADSLKLFGSADRAGTSNLEACPAETITPTPF